VDHRRAESLRAARHPRCLKKAKAGTHDHKHLEELLLRRGLINRLFMAGCKNPESQLADVPARPCSAWA
jgi:hypothetical protein